MVIKRKKIVINGEEIDVDVFETSFTPGKGDEDIVISNLLKEVPIGQQVNKVRRGSLVVEIFTWLGDKISLPVIW